MVHSNINSTNMSVINKFVNSAKWNELSASKIHVKYNYKEQFFVKKCQNTYTL